MISDQISRLQRSGIRASIVNVNKEPKPELSSDEELDDTADDTDSETNVKIDFGLCQEQKLRSGNYEVIFAHPEAVVSSKYGRKLLLTGLEITADHQSMIGRKLLLIGTEGKLRFILIGKIYICLKLETLDMPIRS